MVLDAKQRSYLRSLAHHRAPAVTVGAAGITESVITEIECALKHHELVKIRLPGSDRLQRRALYRQICQLTAAEPIQEIGRMGVIFRRAERSRLSLS
jgi:RNA-binding protein